MSENTSKYANDQADDGSKKPLPGKFRRNLALYLQVAIVSILGLFLLFVFYDLVLSQGGALSGCATLVIGAVVVPAVFVLLLIKWVIQWWLRKAGVISVPKEEPRVPGWAELLSLAKKRGGPIMEALLAYIDDALRAGQAKERIAAALHDKGWPEGEVAEAFNCYDSLSKARPITWQTAGAEIKARNKNLPFYLSAITVIEILLLILLASGWPAKVYKERRGKALLQAQAQAQLKAEAGERAGEAAARKSASEINAARTEASGKKPVKPVRNKITIADTYYLEDCADGRCTWANAIKYCKGKGGLPTITELKELYVKECTGGVPSDTCNKWYWSSEARSDDPDGVWYMHFHLGTVLNASGTNDFDVRCAR